ncbi:MAG: MMPL family transporter, partial [Myxococcales bacterium]|nr:MMPL family transporter [Myxococcales bacterium]
AVSRAHGGRAPSHVERLLVRVGPRLVRAAPLVVAVAIVLGGVGLVLARDLHVDYERVRNFRSEEPIRRADRAINERMAGINQLDVLIEADAPGALLEPATLARIARFQREVETLPGVGKTTSVVDYLTTMNRALQAGGSSASELPATRSAAAQLALLYDLEGSDAAIREHLDPEDRRALVRISLPSGRYTDEARLVEAVEAAIARHLDDASLEVSLAGRVNVDVRWMRGLERTHFLSVGLALAAVFVVSVLAFGSVVAGLLTILPVVFAVLALYAVMAILDLWLGITTSMFAVLAIGLGVDFSVHALERIRRNTIEQGLSLEAAVLEGLPRVGRELVFNFACAGLGFGVLAFSRVPTLVEFGLLTLTAVSASFVGGLVLLPALCLVFRPRVLQGSAAPEPGPTARAQGSTPRMAKAPSTSIRTTDWPIGFSP